MANYSLVVNSKFQPFSFERYIQPYQMYGEAYKEIENQYGELATKASVWEEMANEQTDPYAYKMYKTYANDLEEQAGQLAREGLNAASRRDMLNMRARYSKEITPIEQAYTARQKQAEEQQKALLQDPTLMLSRRASTTSLDDYIRNPQLAYESYSGKLLTAQVSQAASALSKEMREQPRKWRSILGNSYYETMMQKGFSSDAVLQAIQGNPQASQELTRIVDDALASSGVLDWGDTDIIKRAVGYARDGLWSAVGETQYQTLDNWRAKMAEQEAMQIRADKRKADAAQQARLNNLAINPLNIYSNRELSEDEKKYNDNIKNYSKYFYKKNGQWTINLEGWTAYNNKIKGTAGSPVVTPESTTILTNAQPTYSDSPFKEFMDSIGMRDMGSKSFGDFGAIWGRYVDDSPAARTARYDATKVTEYDYPIASTQQGDMKDAIMTAGRGLSLKEVDYDSKSKQFKDTGEEITMGDLKSDEYKVTATRFSPYGNTVMIQDDTGDVRRFRMPGGINTTNETNRDIMMSWASVLQANRGGGTISIPDSYADLTGIPRGTTITATPKQIQDEYNNAIQQAYLYHSQLGVQNKVKEQEFNPYGY